MVLIEEYQDDDDDESELVHVTLDANGHVVQEQAASTKGAAAGGPPDAASAPKPSQRAANGTAKAKKADAKKPPSAPKGFSVVDGTVVSPHDRVDDDIKAEVEKELGNEAFREQDYDTAVEHYSTALDALSQDPDSNRARTTLLLNRAQAQLKLEEWTEAKVDCTRALQLDSDNLKKCQARAGAHQHPAPEHTALEALLRVAHAFMDDLGGHQGGSRGPWPAAFRAALLGSGDEEAERAGDATGRWRRFGWRAQALYRGALACYKLQQYPTALTWLETALRLAPDDVEVSVLLQRCRAAHLGAASEERVRQQAEAAAEQYGTAARDAKGRVLSTSGLLVVEELVRLLVDADDEDSAEGVDVDVASVLAQLTEALAEHEDHCIYFSACLGHLAVMLFMDVDHCAAAEACLLAYAGADARGARGAPTAWPLALLERLEQTVTDPASPEQVVASAMRVLERVAADAAARSGALCEKSGDDHASVLQRLLRKAAEEPFRLHFHVDAACALARLLLSYSKDAASRAALVAADSDPLTTLLRLYQEADRLPGAFIDVSGLPMNLQEATSTEEAVRFMNTQKRALFNKPAVELKRQALAALAALCKDTQLLRAAAFARKSGRDRQIRTVPTAFLPHLLDGLRALRTLAPLKTAPVLGLDGKPKSYLKKPYAADYIANPVGDMLVNMNDFEVEKGEEGNELVVDGTSGSGNVKEGEGVTLIELLLEVVHAAAHNRNAARTLHSSGALGALERLWDYTTESVLTLVQRVYARLALQCEGVVSELAAASSVLPLMGLLHSRDSRLLMTALTRLLVLLATCSGDDFALWTAGAGGGLTIVWDLLCKMDADKSLVRDPAAAGGKGGMALYHAAQQTLLHSIERGRQVYGKNHMGRPPTGGCWDVIGPMEVLRMEEKITGKRFERPGQSKGSAATAAKAGKVAAPPAAAAAAAAAPPPGAAPAQPKAAAAREEVKLKPLPWDPVSQQQAKKGGGGGAPTKAVPIKQERIKTGFFGPRRKRAARAEEEGRAAERAAVRAAAAAAAERQAAAAAAEAPPLASTAAADDDITAAVAPQPDEYDEAFEQEYEQWKQERAAEMERKRQAALAKAQRGALGSAQAAVEVQDEYDEDGLRTVWDSKPSEDVKDLRRIWLNTDLRDKIRWTQASREVSVWVRVPPGTRKKELQVEITPTRLMIKLHWYGRVVDGPLWRRCKASEACWVLQDDEVHIMIPKDDNYFWKGLFEGGEEKSYVEVLKDLVNCDDEVVAYDELPERAKDLIFDWQENQQLINEGLIEPGGIDDMRIVLGDGDGAK